MIRSESQEEPQSRGWWEKELGRLCQCLVSVDIDTHRLGKNSAEEAQTSHTPMSSCQDYASRGPQEPWKYLDIFSALPACLCNPVHHLLWLRGSFKWPEAEPKKGCGAAVTYLQ
ncbi:hypothetical protein ATANTOWER_026591 [Ataeniobius toweri]|uniref:Uncharacterized protein n=1 Tax=Ataeniobius toweri TaxID=208326 RepID=A0ABU7CG95_9TELE|nr:hypothetical protein [Ataeniobius toweri]